MKNFKATAHRANSFSGYLENTKEAIKYAFNSNDIDSVEIDIQLTKDGRLVLMNYKTLEPAVIGLSEGKNTVLDYTYDELSKMTLMFNNAMLDQVMKANPEDFGNYSAKIIESYKEQQLASAKIPTLEEVLGINRNGKELFIEVKPLLNPSNEANIEYASRVIEVCKVYDLSNVVFISGDTDLLAKIKHSFPLNSCLPVIGYNDAEKVTHIKDGAFAAVNHLLHTVPGTNKSVAEYVLEDNNKLGVWNIRTVNQLAETESIVDVEYNAVSDFPELLNDYAKKLRK